MRVEGSNIFLDGYQIMGIVDGQRGLTPLSVYMVDNRDAVEAVLSCTGCTEAFAENFWQV